MLRLLGLNRSQIARANGISVSQYEPAWKNLVPVWTEAITEAVS
ncbi:MAG TPA: hypothetical protein PLJ27_08615 [Polyangiaceae bacterium]|jgi:hypothetical protein|nr:hypothetical protein [Polyangiaceae bacterium]HQK17503.1 hypothetical protein [Polyangiaceae bacterium]